MFHLLFQVVLPEFDHYLGIYTFSTLQYQFHLQNDYDRVLTVKIYEGVSILYRIGAATCCN
jgi:hypothetical protein